jgi:hypothetical protein
VKPRIVGGFAVEGDVTLSEVAGLRKRFGGLVSGVFEEYRQMIEWRQASLDEKALIY